MPRGAKGERGQALVELALALPLLALIMFAIIDFGLGLNARIQVANAVREGARLGTIVWAEPNAEGLIARRVLERAGAVVNAQLGAVQVAFPEGRYPGASVEVALPCRYNFLVPGLSGIAHLGCGARATMRLE
jgi:hypothetical protein